MATVLGGNTNVVSGDSKTLAVADSFLTTIGVSDANVSTVISGASVTGGSTFVQPTSTSTSSTSVLGTVTGQTTVVLGGANIVINAQTTSTGNTPVVLIEGSKTAGSSTQNSQITSTIADKRLADTPIGQQVKTNIANAVSDLTGTTNKNVVVTEFGGTDGRDTVSVGGGTNDVVVVGMGLTGTKVDISASNSVVVGNSQTVTLSSGGSQTVSLVSFTGKVQGGSGNDTVISGAGSNAIVVGGLGADVFKQSWGGGADSVVASSQLLDDGSGTLQAATSSTPYLKSTVVISDFNGTNDKLGFDINGVTNFTQFKAILATAKQIGDDVVATTRAGDKITLTGVNITTLTEDMFTFG